MPRTRSIIINAPVARLFRDTTTTVNAPANKLLVGSPEKFISLVTVPSLSYFAPPLVRVAANLGGGTGRLAASGGLLSYVALNLARVPLQTAVVFRVRVGASYASSVAIADLTIGVGQSDALLQPNRTLSSTDRVFVDVITSAGTAANYAAGLSVSVGYFTNN